MTAWFENYFARQITIRELNDPTSYDSLEIVKAIAEKQNMATGATLFVFGID